MGNWPGVTVEKKEGELKYKNYNFTFIDLPGTYSLTAYSQEELITRNFILEQKPDVILNIIDGTNLERNLYLTTQLMEMNVRLVTAINMWDAVLQKNIKINIPLLSSLLGVPLVPVSAIKKTGIKDLLEAIVNIPKEETPDSSAKLEYQTDLTEEVTSIEKVLSQDKYLSDNYPLKWLAIKLVEHDQEVYKLIHDRAIHIQVDQALNEALKHLQLHFQQSPESIVAESRYAFINGAIKETIVQPKSENRSWSEKIDDLLLNRFLGLPFFLFFLWSIFQLTFRLGEAPMSWIETLFSKLAVLTGQLLPQSTLSALIVDGVIGGVGGVVVFLPNILLLFLAIAFLEDSGYMARAAFLVDKIMHRFGLHGRSFIPMIMGFGCSVPAFMSCRILKNRADQITTMLVIPFMSCGAKLPVYVLLIGAFFPKHLQGNILFAIYLTGIITALAAASLMKRLFFKGLSEPFVMELPPYRLPTFNNMFIRMWERARMYLKKAGTTILIISVVVWFFSNYPADHTLSASNQLSHSIAGQIGHAIEPIIRPLGFNWKLGIALVTGLAAKEVIVSTLGTIYSIDDLANGANSLQTILSNDPQITPLIALAFLIFTLFYVPCIAATTVFHKEIGQWRWTIFYLFFTTGTAYVMTFMFYQGGRLLGY